MFEHLICREKLKKPIQILVAGISPDYFIKNDSVKLIAHFMQFQRFGIGFLYPEGTHEIPNLVLQAFNIIQNILDQKTADGIKSAKEKNKKDSNPKRTK